MGGITFMTLLHWLSRRAENLAALSLASMFVVFLLQILFRYLLDLPVGWTVEWVTLAWLWGILFGYAFVVRERDVICMDFVYSALPTRWQCYLDIVSSLTIAVILCVSLPKTIEYVQFMAIERTAFMRLPFDWVFAVYIPFIFSIVVRMGLKIWTAISTLRGVEHA